MLPETEKLHGRNRDRGAPCQLRRLVLIPRLEKGELEWRFSLRAKKFGVPIVWAAVENIMESLTRINTGIKEEEGLRNLESQK